MTPAPADPRRVRGHHDRPRRTWYAPTRAINVRRERTADGWCLHFTGRDAQSGLIDDVIDRIEALFLPY